MGKIKFENALNVKLFHTIQALHDFCFRSWPSKPSLGMSKSVELPHKKKNTTRRQVSCLILLDHASNNHEDTWLVINAIEWGFNFS